VKIAYCTSFRCDPRQRSALGRQKDQAQAGSTNCPDCGALLIWHDERAKCRPGMDHRGKWYAERKSKKALESAR
jgi:predicted RNA-binding Zn-ribbon protein involved in translation (DUF1610 family)